MSDLPSMTEAIANAALNIPTEATPVVPAAVPETPKSPAPEIPETPAATEPPKSEPPKSEEPPPQTPNEAEMALQFYKALQDPNAAPALVKFLAEQVGLSVAPSKPEAAPPPEDTITTLVQKELGEEYGFIAPKLGAAIEKIVNKYIEPIRAESARSAAVNEYDRAVAELNAETGGDFKKVENEIVKAMDVLRPSDKTNTKQYLTHLYRTVKGNNIPQVSQQAAAAVVNKIQKNASEAIPSPSAATDSRVLTGPGMPSLDQAIEMAINSLQK